MRILFLFLFTALSFVTYTKTGYLHTVVWYFIFVNSFASLLFLINFLLLKNDKNPLKNKMLIYFSLIGGVFGAFLIFFATRFYKIEKRILFFEGLILSFWILLFMFLYRFYEPFREIISNLPF